MSNVENRRGGRKRTGTFESAGFHNDGTPRFRFRLRLADGSKSPRITVPHGFDETRARAYVAGLQADEDTNGEIFKAMQERRRKRAAAAGEACEGESADTWHARFLMTRNEGRRSDSGYRWKKWVSPRIGAKPMATITKGDIEDVRDALDAALREYEKHGRGPGRINAKTALNIWACVTTAFKHACQSKQKDLRVREDNPCANVLPPEKGDSRRKAYFYPREVLQLLECEDVPREWREVYAIACYLYLRPGELYELRWSDVDLKAGVVRISRAWEWIAKKVKAPKTSNGIRVIPIETSLLPLLERMADGKPTNAKVVPIFETTGKDKSAALLREHLAKAKVTHARLFADNATHMPVNFRTWRDSGLTWLAHAGVDVVKMQRRAGHDSLETTTGYVKSAEEVTEAVGKPFPALPSKLVWPSDWTSSKTPKPKKQAFAVPTQGFESSPASIIVADLGESDESRSSSQEDDVKNAGAAPGFGPGIGPVEAALAKALEAATSAQRWDIVASIARELEARRLAARNVIAIDATRRRSSK